MKTLPSPSTASPVKQAPSAIEGEMVGGVARRGDRFEWPEADLFAEPYVHRSPPPANGAE